MASFESSRQKICGVVGGVVDKCSYLVALKIENWQDDELDQFVPEADS